MRTKVRSSRDSGPIASLGAQPGDVLRIVVAQGMKLAAAGVMMGLGGAFLVGRALASLLFGVNPRDPLTFVVIGVALMVVGMVASHLPARRATKMDPLAALRNE